MQTNFTKTDTFPGKIKNLNPQAKAKKIMFFSKNFLYIYLIFSAQLFSMHPTAPSTFIPLPIQESDRAAARNLAKDYLAYCTANNWRDSQNTRKAFLANEDPILSEIAENKDLDKINQGLILLHQEKLQREIEAFTDRNQVSAGAIDTFLLKNQLAKAYETRTITMHNKGSRFTFVDEKNTPLTSKKEALNQFTEKSMAISSGSTSSSDREDRPLRLRKKHSFEEDASPFSQLFAKETSSNRQNDTSYSKNDDFEQEIDDSTDESDGIFSFIK